MSAALAAARLGDEIEHSSALMGFLIGAVIGLAVGVAIVAATVATGGAALAVVAAVGTGMAAAGGGALLGEALGSTFTSPAGVIAPLCSPNVHVNGIPAARAIHDMGACTKDGPPPVHIAQGSKRVHINGFPAARKGDHLVCDGKISKGSSNVHIGAEPGTFLEIHGEVPEWMNTVAQVMVIAGTVIALGAGAAGALVSGGLCGLAGFAGEAIGGFVGSVIGGDIGGVIGKAIGGERGEIIGNAIGALAGGYLGAKAGGRMTAGHPVDVATGEVFTEITDFSVNGAIPLVWSRLWISSSTIKGSLGHGWHHSYDMALTAAPDEDFYVVRLSDGRLALLPPATPGNPSINAAEQLILHTDGTRFWLLEYEGIAYEFGPAAPDGLRHLIRIADANRNEIRLERNAEGHLFAIVDSAGRLFAVTNDNEGRIVSIDAPHPDRAGETLRLVSYSYDAAGDLIESRDARGATLNYAYYNHLLTEERRRSGFVFHFVWDDPEKGRTARCVDTWGDGGLFRARLEYDVEEHLTVVTTGRGAVSRYQWNTAGLVEEELDPLGGRTRRQYDEAGRLTLMAGASGETTATFAYDELGRPIETGNAAGETTRIEYALEDLRGVGHGNPARITAPDGAVHHFSYDARGNLATHTDPLGVERRYLRDERGLPLEISDGMGVWRRFRWSAASNLEWVGAEQGGAQIRFWHDALGRVVGLARGGDAPTHFVRDANGNLAGIQRLDGLVTLEYDAEDRLTRHRDQMGRETRWRYGGPTIPLERVAADGSRFTYCYDSELNLTGLENPKGERYELAYDAAGRLVREVGFDGRALDYRYDPSGRLLERIDAGRSTKFVRDALGRLLEKQFADGTSQRFAWDAGGRLVACENAAHKVEFAYNSAGRLIRETQNGLNLEHAYDDRGRRVASRLPDGRQLQMAYGVDDLFTKVAFDGAVIAEVTRDTAGREVQRRAGQVRQQQAYDPQGRLAAQRGLRGAETVFARRYDYDTSDVLRQVVDAQRGLKQYEYDACERLVGVEAAEPERFVFDPAGNLIASWWDGAGQAEGDRLLSYDDKRFSYDEHGNRVRELSQLEGRQVEYRYGPDNELAEVAESSGRVTRFGYDALGRRVWKETRDAGEPILDSAVWQRTEFLWNGDVLLAESADRQDPLETVYLYEPASFRPLAQVRGGKAYHYHLDHLGTPQEMTDGQGEVVWSADLKAWGQVRVKYVGKIENPLRFQGQYCDEETGLHYNRFRYYSPGQARFIHQDPIGLLGGTNLASYAPNPLHWLDPWGLTCTFDDRANRWRDSQTGRFVKPEEYYRTMSPSHYEQLVADGKLLPTSETFTSPTQSFSEDYEGVLVKFNMEPGTTSDLEGIGVRDNSAITQAKYPDMPPVSKGWTKTNAFFKGEGDQINVGLGRGKALGVFNSRIAGFSRLP